MCIPAWSREEYCTVGKSRSHSKVSQLEQIKDTVASRVGPGALTLCVCVGRVKLDSQALDSPSLMSRCPRPPSTHLFQGTKASPKGYAQEESHGPALLSVFAQILLWGKFRGFFMNE